MKTLEKALLLTVCSLMFCASAYAEAPSVGNISSIQAFTDGTFYGTGVVEVAVTYQDGVDLSAVTASSYILQDRGSMSPDFGEIQIAEAVVNGPCVTLRIANNTAATIENTMNRRLRNTYGVYCTTGSWFRDINGVIHYGNGDESKGYAPNEIILINAGAGGFQARKCLELKLRHKGEDAGAALCLADDKGRYNPEGKWLQTVDRQFGEKGFQSFEQLGIRIESTAADAGDATADAYVRGYAFIPENYDKSNGIVFTLQGQGICYYRLEDGTDNDGTGFMYDTSAASWADTGAIVVHLHDRSSAAAAYGKWYENYDFVVDDARVMKFFIEKYGISENIVLTGNSRGTIASSILIKALAGQPYNSKNQNRQERHEETKRLSDVGEFSFTVDTFICQNGWFGATYTEADWSAVANTGLRVWAFDGEQDPAANNYKAVEAYKARMAELKGRDWAEKNIRLTGLPSELFAYWGESDHSVTRINGWYFANTPFYGPDVAVNERGELVYERKLNDGAVYELAFRGEAGAVKKAAGSQYTIYGDTFHSWALNK